MDNHRSRPRGQRRLTQALNAPKHVARDELGRGRPQTPHTTSMPTRPSPEQAGTRCARWAEALVITDLAYSVGTNSSQIRTGRTLGTTDWGAHDRGSRIRRRRQLTRAARGNTSGMTGWGEGLRGSRVRPRCPLTRGLCAPEDVMHDGLLLSRDSDQGRPGGEPHVEGRGGRAYAFDGEVCRYAVGCGIHWLGGIALGWAGMTNSPLAEGPLCGASASVAGAGGRFLRSRARL
jgi:hypothetical protein